MPSDDETPTSASPAAPPGTTATVCTQLVDQGARLLQSLAPIKKMNQHACSFALYAHDLRRQMEIHLFAARLNDDFLQCAVYDSAAPSPPPPPARLIGVEYIVSAGVFEGLPEKEQKLWHSHAYEIKSGLYVNPGVPEMLQRPAMAGLSKTYGKFWCTWQVDRGDALPVGSPALMVSTQAVEPGRVRPELVEARNAAWGVDSAALRASRVEMAEPEWINPNSDYWRQHRKGLAVDVLPSPVPAMTICSPAGRV